MAVTKGTKRQVLEFIKKHDAVCANQLTDRFRYTYSYAYKRLSLLKREGLVFDLGRASGMRGWWSLTEKGHRRVDLLRRREGKGIELQREQAVRRGELAKLERDQLAKLEKRVGELQRENVELQELVKVSTGPGGLEGVVSRLAEQWLRLARDYAHAVELGVNPNQFDLAEPGARLEKLLKYIEFLPADKRQKVLEKIGLPINSLFVRR